MASEAELVDGRCEPGLDFSTPGWPHVFYQSLTSVLLAGTRGYRMSTLWCMGRYWRYRYMVMHGGTLKKIKEKR